MEKKNTNKVLIASLVILVLVVLVVWVTWVVVENSTDIYLGKLVVYYKAVASESTNRSMVAPGFVDGTGIKLEKGYEIYSLGSHEVSESNQMVVEYILINRENRTKVAYVNEALFEKSLDPKILSISKVKKGKLVEK